MFVNDLFETLIKPLINWFLSSRFIKGIVHFRYSLLVKPEQSDPSVLIVENIGAACDLQSARWSQPSLASRPDFVFAVEQAFTQAPRRLFRSLRCVSSPRRGTPRPLQG